MGTVLSIYTAPRQPGPFLVILVKTSVYIICASENVAGLCRERTNLAIQLKDTKTVVGRLKFVISVILHILFVFFYLTIYNVRPLLPLFFV